MTLQRSQFLKACSELGWRKDNGFPRWRVLSDQIREPSLPGCARNVAEDGQRQQRLRYIGGVRL